MKKLIYCALALATGLFAASCQQENLEPVAQGNTVTFEVSIPELATKGLGDNVSNINDLVYAVYSTTATTLENVQNGSAGYELLYQKNYARDVNPFNGGNTAIIPIELVNDKNYFVIFWAQNEDRWVGESFDLRSVAYPAEGMYANDNDYAAFSGISFITSDNLSAKKSVILKRPFAQINIGTQLATEFTITPTTSSVTVNKAGTSFNLIKQVAEGEGSVTFKTANVPTNPDRTEDGKLVVNNTAYTYVAMNYVFANGNVDVEYTINTEAHGTVSNKVSNVPVAANYRTNIVGRLLTSTADYTVVLGEFDTNNNSGTTEVITEGLVRNQNGDYEVSNENGLAHAINTLFAEGGNFYLTKDVYDISGFEVTPPTIPAGKTLNIYGETPIVTRAASTLAGITIIGLPEVEGTPTLIAQVEEGGSVSVSGVTLDDEGSVLVENNEGTLVISETTADEIVSNGNNPVPADKIENFASLKAAVESGIKVIEIAADIEATDAIWVNRSVVINGNSNTWKTSANRAIRINASDVEIEINDLNIISSAVANYQSDARGVSIDPQLSNVSLTLNNCTVDFVDKSANDWTYAVNVSGNGTGHKVTVNGGTYEGANVVNLHGAKNILTIQNATLTSLYPANEVYYGACIWVLQKNGSSVYAEGNTFNGTNAVAFNLGTGTALEEKENTDNTMMYRYKSGSDLYYTLADAIEAIETTGEIKVLHNAEAESVTIPNGKTITLNLNDKTIEGVDNATGSYAVITNKGNLTVVGPGAMKLTATNNRGWNAYSSVISNTVGGNLTVQGEVVIEHLGGTDMAYGIDNLTNGKGTSAITTINKATVKSPYRAIRQFLNGIEATNELYVNPEAVIEGANKSIWMQDPSTNANTGKLVVEEGAELYGDVYLSVTAGSTEWPVSASIPTSTLMNGSKVLTGNLPEGYSVEEKNGVYEVTYKSPAQARLEALINEGGEVVLTENIELSSPIVIENLTVTLDLNGKTITAGKDGYAIENKGELTIKNNGVINGVVYAEGPTAKTTINGGTYNALTNWVFLNSQGAFLEINDATINGGSSYPIYSYDANSKLVINDATVNATFGCINAYGTNGSVEINGGTFQMTGVQGKTSHIAYFSNVDAVINGGTFEKVGDINMSGTGGGGICAIYGAALKIVKGTFAGDYADLYDWGGKNGNDRAVAISVEGGTYKFKPTFLAKDFAATQNADGTWTVAEN